VGIFYPQNRLFSQLPKATVLQWTFCIQYSKSDEQTHQYGEQVWNQRHTYL